MVARTELSRRDFLHPEEETTPTMDPRKPEKENHLIEAIVFTADFLSCHHKKPSRGAGSSWMCGSGSTEETSDESTTDCFFNNSFSKNDDDGYLFGMKRKQLISYENAEDLSRKVDALSHHSRSPASFETLEIRDDDVKENNEICRQKEFYQNNCFDNCHSRSHSQPSGRKDKIPGHLPRKNSPLTTEELKRWYSSSWSSFTYYGNAKESSQGVVPSKMSLGPNSTKSSSHHNQHSSQRFLPKSRKSKQRVRTSRKHGLRPKEPLGYEQRTSSSGSSSLPEFLKEVEFKGTTKYHRHKFSVISLPPSPPISVSTPMEVSSEVVESNEKEFGFSTPSRPRRFGRKAREYWKKAKGFFRR